MVPFHLRVRWESRLIFAARAASDRWSRYVTLDFWQRMGYGAQSGSLRTAIVIE